MLESTQENSIETTETSNEELTQELTQDQAALAIKTSVDLPLWLSVICEAASVDSKREAINHILIEVNTQDAQSIIVATDGHMLVKLLTNDIFGLKTGCYLINASEFTQETKCALLKNKNAASCNVKLCNENNVGTYPDYKQVIPKKSDKMNSASIGVDVDQLKKIQSILLRLDKQQVKKCKNDHDVISVNMRDDCSPMLLNVNCNESIIGVLMPCSI